MPYQVLQLVRGTSFSLDMQIVDNLKNPMNVEDFSFVGQMRKHFKSTSYVQLNITEVDLTIGKINISIADTSTLDAGRYVFDILAIDENELRASILSGHIIVQDSAYIEPVVEEDP